MIKKCLFLILFTLIVGSCSSPIKAPKVISIDQSIEAECASAACPSVIVQYLNYDGKPEKVQAINDSIDQFIINALNLGDINAPAISKNPKEAISNFIKDYWRDMSEFPDSNEYEAEVTVVENFRSKNLLSILLTRYSYTGGAHGYSMVVYKNVESKSGKVLTNDALIKDLEGLRNLAEAKLRETYNLDKTAPLNSTIFWFEDDVFQLSETIGIEEEHLVIHYNQYEIASYADGPISIKIPLEEVGDFLNYSLEK